MNNLQVICPLCLLPSYGLKPGLGLGEASSAMNTEASPWGWRSNKIEEPGFLDDLTLDHLLISGFFLESCKFLP